LIAHPAAGVEYGHRDQVVAGRHCVDPDGRKGARTPRPIRIFRTDLDYRVAVYRLFFDLFALALYRTRTVNALLACLQFCGRRGRIRVLAIVTAHPAPVVGHVLGPFCRIGIIPANPAILERLKTTGVILCRNSDRGKVQGSKYRQ
jgi:hypothetical protein